MDEQDFLEFGLCINNAEESRRLNARISINQGLDGLLGELEAWPDDPDRTYLLNAARRKRQGRYVLYSQEWKERLQPLARLWCGLGKQRESYQDVLSGLASIEQLKEGQQKTQKFHDVLIGFVGSADRPALIKGLLRIQEAAPQFSKGYDGKDKPLSKWTTLTSVRTVWGVPVGGSGQKDND